MSTALKIVLQLEGIKFSRAAPLPATMDGTDPFLCRWWLFEFESVLF